MHHGGEHKLYPFKALCAVWWHNCAFINKIPQFNKAMSIYNGDLNLV
jgi:hypothetical protein